MYRSFIIDAYPNEDYVEFLRLPLYTQTGKLLRNVQLLVDS